MKFLLLLILSTTIGYAVGQDLSCLRDSAIALAENERYVEAVKVMTKVIAREPYSHDHYARRGTYHYHCDNFKAFLSDMDSACKYSENHYQERFTYQWKAYYYQGQNNFKEVVSAYSRIMQFSRLDLEESLTYAYSRYRIGEYDSARFFIENCREYDELLPEQQVIFLHYLISFHQYTYCNEEIVQCAKKILSIEPDNEKAINSYLSALIDEEDLSSSIALIDSKIHQFPHRKQLIYMRGQVYAFFKNYNKALEDYLTIKNDSTSQIDTDQKMWKAFQGLNQFENADSLIKEAQKNDSDDVFYFNALAWNSMLAGNYQTGLNHINKAIRLEPKEGSNIDTRGTIYYQLKNYQLAIEDFNTALKLDTSLYSSNYYRGLCYMKLGDKSKACIDFTKCKNEQIDYLVNDINVRELIEVNCASKPIVKPAPVSQKAKRP